MFFSADLPKMIQFPGSTSYIHWEVQYHFWEDSILSLWKSMRSFLFGKYVMLLLWYLGTSSLAKASGRK